MFGSIPGNNVSASHLHSRLHIFADSLYLLMGFGVILCSFSMSEYDQLITCVLLYVQTCSRYVWEKKALKMTVLLLLFFLQKQLCAKYDTFQLQLEAAGKRVMACQQLADNLLNCGHSDSREIRQKQKELR